MLTKAKNYFIQAEVSERLMRKHRATLKALTLAKVTLIDVSVYEDTVTILVPDTEIEAATEALKKVGQNGQ